MHYYKFNELNYAVHLPPHLEARNPAILFLHGAGTRGGNIHLMEENPFFRSPSCICDHNSPFIVFAPQCYKDTWFDIFEQLQSFAHMLQEDPRVDPDRIYLVGASMGGYAVWQLAMSMPSVFAAIVPICGGGMNWNAKRISHLPIRAFHGKDDPVVPSVESIMMVDAVNRAGGNATLTLLDNVQHNSWDYAYSSKDLFDWLLLQRKVHFTSDSNSFSSATSFG